MIKTLEGQLVVKGKKFGLVTGRFNNFITGKLLEGAIDALSRHGVKEEEMEVVWVPGSFEIPYAAGRMRSEERRVGKECRSRWSPSH